MTEMFICIGVIDECQNVEESYVEICVQCNKCGRFDDEDGEDDANGY